MSMKMEELQAAASRFVPHHQQLLILFNHKNSLQCIAVGYMVAEKLKYRIYL